MTAYFSAAKYPQMNNAIAELVASCSGGGCKQGTGQCVSIAIDSVRIHQTHVDVANAQLQSLPPRPSCAQPMRRRGLWLHAAPQLRTQIISIASFETGAYSRVPSNHRCAKIGKLGAQYACPTHAPRDVA